MGLFKHEFRGIEREVFVRVLKKALRGNIQNGKVCWRIQAKLLSQIQRRTFVEVSKHNF